MPYFRFLKYERLGQLIWLSFFYWGEGRELWFSKMQTLAGKIND